MRTADIKYDIKVLFFIVNSYTGLLTGLLAFSLGVTIGVYGRNPGATAAGIVGGLLLLGPTALGYVGAILQNRIMLFVFTGLTVLEVIIDIVGAILSGSMEIHPFLVLTIIHLGLSILAMTLALVLAKTAHKPSDQGAIISPPPGEYNPAV